MTSRRCWTSTRPIPENLRASEVVSQLEETIDYLQTAHEALADVELPRGFGR